MTVTNIVLETLPGRAHSVADLMGQVKGMGLLSVEGDHRVVATWTIPEGHHPEPEGISEVLRAMTDEILEVALMGEREPDWGLSLRRSRGGWRPPSAPGRAGRWR